MSTEAYEPVSPSHNLRKALEGIADDYMTSEQHHPGYVLIPITKFEQLRTASEALSALIPTEAKTEFDRGMAFGWASASGLIQTHRDMQERATARALMAESALAHPQQGGEREVAALDRTDAVARTIMGQTTALYALTNAIIAEHIEPLRIENETLRARVEEARRATDRVRQAMLAKFDTATRLADERYHQLRSAEAERLDRADPVAPTSPSKSSGEEACQDDEDRRVCYMCDAAISEGEEFHTHPLEGDIHARCCSGEEDEHTGGMPFGGQSL